ncbi:MAG: hypothetical protein ACRCST_04365 [Turicibacter sp.]
MIYIRVELWPFGDQSKAEVIGEAKIANNGTGSRNIGNYNYSLFGKLRTQAMQTGQITAFRRRDGNVWDLLAGILSVRSFNQYFNKKSEHTWKHRRDVSESKTLEFGESDE